MPSPPPIPLPPLSPHVVTQGFVRTFTQMKKVMTEEEIAMVAAWEEQEWGRLEMGYPFVYSGK